MVAWWDADAVSGTTAFDIQGTNNGTLMNNITTVPGKVGNAFSFDGVNDYVQMATPYKFDHGQDFTIDLWVMKPKLSSVHRSFILDTRQGTLFGVALVIRPDETVLLGGRCNNYDTGFNAFSTSKILPDDQWHHIAAVVDWAANESRLYIDGALEDTGDLTNCDSFTNSDKFFLGAVGDLTSSLFFEGSIDEVEVFNRALTTQDVKAIYNAGSMGKCKPDSLGTICGTKFNDLNGNGVQDSTETSIPGWTVYLSGTVTDSILTDSLGNYCFNSLPPGIYTVTEEQQSGWTPTTPVSQTDTLGVGQTLTVSFGNHKGDCVSPPDSMVAWWPLDETSGTIANDIAGFNNVGTYFGGPVQVPGKVAGALSFNGSTDYVEVADHPELNFGTGDFSIDAWVRTTQTDRATIIDKRTGTNTNPVGYTLFVSGGKLGFQIGDGSPFLNHNSPNPAINDGNWHHVAVTINRTSATGGSLYVDGVLNLTFDPTTQQGNISNTANLWIGQHQISSVQRYHSFQGAIDEVELFNRVLTPDEVFKIWFADSLGKCKIPSTDTCQCDEWIDTLDVVYSLEGGSPASATCGDTKNILLGTKIGISNFTGNFICKGTNCIAEYRWTITDPSGVLIEDGSGKIINVDFTALKTGDYTLTITPTCGNEKCLPCVITFKVVKLHRWKKLIEKGILTGENDPVNIALNKERKRMADTELGSAVEQWYDELNNKDWLSIMLKLYPDEVKSVLSVGRKLIQEGGKLDSTDLTIIEKTMRILDEEIVPAPEGLIDKSLKRLRASIGMNWDQIMENYTK